MRITNRQWCVSLAQLRMRCIQFSAKYLLGAVGIAASLCTIPASMVQGVRVENAAGDTIEQAAVADMLACGEKPQPAISRSRPPTAGRRLIHWFADSEGSISRVDIRGDKTARAIASSPVALRGVQQVRLLPAGKAGSRPTITQLQIDALSNMESVEWLDISGRFAPNLRFDALSRLKRLNRLEIEADVVPAALFQAFTAVDLDLLLIVGDDDSGLINPLPPDAAASLRRIRCADLTIFGAIDDLALEEIARTAGLYRLRVECPILIKGQKGITDGGVKRACRFLHVRELEIGGDYELSAAAAEALASIAELQSFGLIMTADCRERLLDLRPDLK